MFQFAAADIVCIGAIRLPDRLAELILPLLFGVQDDNGANPISGYIIVLPPAFPSSVDEESEIRKRLAAVTEERRGYALSAEESEILTRRIKIARSADFDVQTAYGVLNTLPPCSVAVICNCELYRDRAAAMPRSESQPAGASLEEDVWVPHVHALALRGAAVAKLREAYVIFDVGEALPRRSTNKQLLMSIDACGLAGVDDGIDPAIDIATLADEWTRQVRMGHSDAAIASIEALPPSMAPYKPRLKVQILQQANRHEEAVQLIRTIHAATPLLEANLQVRFARFAAAGGDSSVARELLAASLPRLAQQESLELALSVALSLRSIDVEGEALRRLEAGYPTSAALRQRRAWQFIQRSLAVARGEPPPVWAARKPADIIELHDAFMAVAAERAIPNYAEFLAEAERHWPSLLPVVRLACSVHALARDRAEVALATTAPTKLGEYPALQEYAADVLLEALRLALLGRTVGFDPETLIPAIAELIHYLAMRPQEAARRVALAGLLSVPSAGEIGLPLTTLSTVLLSSREQRRSEAVGHGVHTGEPDRDALLRTYRSALQWAQDNGPIELGSAALPAELLEVTADEFLPHLQYMAEAAGECHETEADLKWLEQIIVLAGLTAPHGSTRRNDDLEILRFAAGRFALAGRHQKARDLAEQALLLARGDPMRSRLAWYAFADIYHRVNNLPEALLAMACALACDVPISSEQAWYEANGLIRMLRDLGMIDHALGLIPRARILLEEMGRTERQAHRLDTLELTIRMLASKGKDVRAEDCRDLLESIARNYSHVCQARDELAPVTMLLAQAIELCEGTGVPIGQAHRASLEEALGLLSPDVTAWIRATSRRTPPSGDVLRLAHGLQSARYSDDIGYDVRALVLASSRLLASPEAQSHSEIATFAIEMMTDHGVALPLDHEPTAGAPQDWLASNLGAPAKAAEQLSRNGITVALLGLDINSHLVHVTFREGESGPVVCEDPSTFSRSRFQEWAERYPYAYGVDTAVGNTFHTSQQGMGTTLQLQTRALLVTAAPLQILPPNIVLINGELAGRKAAMASAPSLAWITARRRVHRGQSGRRYAWIPLTEDEANRGTLEMVAERLKSCLSDHEITLDTGIHMPKDLTHSSLVVVVAHGQIGPDGSYFQSMADDDGRRVSPIYLARALAHTHIVVLFVCSGGRTDKHPYASTTVGLPKEVLDRGCSAVVASPWPLDSRVPSHWLPAFLEKWDVGTQLIDANFRANKAVERAMGDAPELCLAMNVYGDPLASAATRDRISLPQQ
jgi:hypothetical protein